MFVQRLQSSSLLSRSSPYKASSFFDNTRSFRHRGRFHYNGQLGFGGPVFPGITITWHGHSLLSTLF